MQRLEFRIALEYMLFQHVEVADDVVERGLVVKLVAAAGSLGIGFLVCHILLDEEVCQLLDGGKGSGQSKKNAAGYGCILIIGLCLVSSKRNLITEGEHQHAVTLTAISLVDL